jgi:hypothetical protein
MKQPPNMTTFECQVMERTRDTPLHPPNRTYFLKLLLLYILPGTNTTTTTTTTTTTSKK